MDNQYQEIFKGFSQKVSALNETERKKFLKELDQVFDKIKASIPKMVDRSCHEVLDVFSKDLQNVSKENSEKLSEFRKYIDEMNRRSAEFTNASKKNAERIQELTQELDSRLIEVKDAIKTIDQEYETVFEGFSQNVAALNEAERARFKAEIENILVDYRGTFGEELGKKYEHISEKFRKDLEEIYVEYDRQLNENTSYLSKTKACASDMEMRMKENISAMNKLNDRLKHSFSELKNGVDSVKGAVDDVLQANLAEAVKLNQKEQTAFSREILDQLNHEYQKHEEIIGEQLRGIQETGESIQKYATALAKVIAAIGKKMEEQQACLTKATEYMQEGYKEQFAQYIDEIVHFAKQEREETVSSVAVMLDRQRAQMEELASQQKKELGIYYQKQENLVKEMLEMQHQENRKLLDELERKMMQEKKTE